jgi:aerobic-type carbon monoxide dehydrogenase small subunit (CoxS/CutS family)
MTLTELLKTSPDASEEEVRIALSGHICRCTGYENIVRAAMATLAQGGASHGPR